MKRVLLFVFFIPYFSLAQKNKYAEALFGLKQDTNAKYIKLPPLWRSDFYNLYRVGKYSSYRYLIKEESTYLKIFSRYHRDSLPVFDFTKQELVVSIACSQCLVVCKHNDFRDNEPCHRNACNYSEIWFVREKRKESTIDE